MWQDFVVFSIAGSKLLILDKFSTYYYYSGLVRIPDEKGHRSGGKAASIPTGKRPAFRSNPASIK